MDESRTQDRTEQYVGPSAMRIADLLPHRVSFERAGSGRARRSATAESRTDWRSGSDRTATASRSSATPGLLPGRGHNRAGSPHRAAHLDGIRAGERRGGQGPREAALVEAQEGRGGRGHCPGRCGAAANPRPGALLPEPRGFGHRGAAAEAVHAPASSNKKVQALTASGRSQPIPTRKGRLHPGAALLLCPQAGAD